MAEVNMARAKEVYEAFCSGMDEMGWNYERNDDDLIIKSGARGEDLPIDILIKINPNAQVISVFSLMPFKVAEEKRVDAAIAVCVANYGLVNGSFDYDISDGSMMFRTATSYLGNEVTSEFVNYILMVTATTTDKYNDRFFMLSKGMLDIEKFIEMEKNN